MNFAVELDNQLGLNADEINDKKVDGVLTAELRAQLRAAQALPKGVLGGRGGLAVFAGVGFQPLFPSARLGGINVPGRGQGVRFSGCAARGSRFEPRYNSYFSNLQSIGPLNSGVRRAGFSPMLFAASRFPVNTKAL